MLGAWLKSHECYWGGSRAPLQLLFVGMKLPCVSVFLLCPMDVASFPRIPQNFRFAVAVAQAPDVLSPKWFCLLCLDRLCALRGVGWGALQAKGLQACPDGSVPMETGGADGATLWGEEGGTDQSCGDAESEQTQKDATSSGFLRSLGTFEAGLGDG